MRDGTRRPAEVKLGDRLEERRRTVTRRDLRRFATAAQDPNPIHLSDEAARAVGLPGIVCHGMLIAAGALHNVERWLVESDQLLQTSFHFAVPLFVPPGVGVEVVFQGRVAALEDGVASIRLRAESGGEPLLVGSTAHVRLAG